MYDARINSPWANFSFGNSYCQIGLLFQNYILVNKILKIQLGDLQLRIMGTTNIFEMVKAGCKNYYILLSVLYMVGHIFSINMSHAHALVYMYVCMYVRAHVSLFQRVTFK